MLEDFGWFGFYAPTGSPRSTPCTIFRQGATVSLSSRLSKLDSYEYEALSANMVKTPKKITTLHVSITLFIRHTRKNLTLVENPRGLDSGMWVHPCLQDSLLVGLVRPKTVPRLLEFINLLSRPAPQRHATHKVSCRMTLPCQGLRS